MEFNIMHKNTPKTVYHYCSLDTFLNIVKNKTIRLSDVNKYNDYLELKSLLNSIENATLKISEESDLAKYESFIYCMDTKSAVKYVIKNIFQNLITYNNILVYAACFSEEKDLLNQWIEYADHGNGVAIGFNLASLQKICNDYKEQLIINKVHYTSEKDNIQNDLINEYAQNYFNHILYAIINETDTLFDYMNLDFNYGLHAILNDSLFSKSVFIKNKSFKAEKEWRLLFYDELKKDYDDWGNYFNFEDCDNSHTIFPMGIQFRSSSNNIISYLDLLFEKYKKNIIDNIIIGPNCKLTQSDIYQIMNHYKFDYSMEQSIKSNCPYKIH